MAQVYHTSVRLKKIIRDASAEMEGERLYSRHSRARTGIHQVRTCAQLPYAGNHQRTKCCREATIVL